MCCYLVCILSFEFRPVHCRPQNLQVKPTDLEAVSLCTWTVLVHIELPLHPWNSPYTHGTPPIHMKLSLYTWNSPYTHGTLPTHMELSLHTWNSRYTHGTLPIHMEFSPYTWNSPYTHGTLPIHMELSLYTWNSPYTSFLLHRTPKSNAVPFKILLIKHVQITPSKIAQYKSTYLNISRVLPNFDSQRSSFSVF